MAEYFIKPSTPMPDKQYGKQCAPKQGHDHGQSSRDFPDILSDLDLKSKNIFLPLKQVFTKYSFLNHY